MKKLLCTVLSLSIILALCACGNTLAPLKSPAPSLSPNAEDTPEPSPTQAPYTDPLSGEGTDEDISAMRPWAVMINNLQQALPQRGVSQAEIIYEIPAEGGVTRMLAVFSDISDVEALGSMRSIRPYYADVALSYDAVIVHAGGSEASYTEMNKYYMQHLDGVLGNYNGDTFYRDPERMKYGLEHSMFTSGERLLTAAEAEDFSLEHDGGDYDYKLLFSDNASGQCREKAEYVRINYNSFKWTSFVYDEGEDVYKAYEYGERYIDSNTDEQMSFSNILILTTGISVLDDVGRLSVRTTGTGDGIFCCGGKRVDIIWHRDSDTSQFYYTLQDGAPLELAAGKTFISIKGDYGTSVVYEK